MDLVYTERRLVQSNTPRCGWSARRPRLSTPVSLLLPNAQIQSSMDPDGSLCTRELETELANQRDPILHHSSHIPLEPSPGAIPFAQSYTADP